MFDNMTVVCPNISAFSVLRNRKEGINRLISAMIPWHSLWVVMIFPCSVTFLTSLSSPAVQGRCLRKKTFAFELAKAPVVFDVDSETHVVRNN